QNAKVTKFLCPTVEKEQQKIAHCLSSLDEVIGLQAKKVQALKQHKNGLMQQIFPAEGETTPRLRFPEFREAGAWEVKRLGDVCVIRTGKKDANEGHENGIYPFFTCAENHIYSNSHSFDCEAILVAGNANVGQTKHYRGKFEAYQRTYVLTDFSDINTQYLYSYLGGNLQNDMALQVQTSAMSYIKLPMLKNYKVPAPRNPIEQQKIAHCLSSLDEVIGLESHKLDALKNLKKGLMQQLFPQEVA
ncbi:restriction endonuclease subunit S, partial [Thiolapillus sp.]|uniref:restriction endonuclease subunit S n=1 Tax=Thiolapillus sp. TaxID=2017437 RepID=UPI003AF4CEAB